MKKFDNSARPTSCYSQFSHFPMSFSMSTIIIAALIINISCGGNQKNSEQMAAEAKARQDSIAAIELAIEIEKAEKDKYNCTEQGSHYARAEHNNFVLIITDFNAPHVNRNSFPLRDYGLEFEFKCFNNGNKTIKAFKVRIEFYTSIGKFSKEPHDIYDISTNCNISPGEKLCSQMLSSEVIATYSTNDPPGKTKAHFEEILYDDNSRYLK